MFQFTPSCSLVKLSQKNQRCKSPPPASFWQNLGQAVPRVVFICKSCAFAATIVIVGMKMMMMMMRCIAKHSYSNNAPLQPLLSSPALHRPGGFIRHLSTSPPAPSSRLKIHFKNPPGCPAFRLFRLQLFSPWTVSEIQRVMVAHPVFPLCCGLSECTCSRELGFRFFISSKKRR